MSKLLLVDDDLEFAKQLSAWLLSEGYVVDVVNSGQDAVHSLSCFNFDVIILDWNLGDLSGLEVCKKYRGSGGKTPIIFLTAQGDISFKAAGLDSGGDDYLTKPFDVRELGARLRSLLRRSSGLATNELKIKDLVLEVETRTVESKAGKLRLTLRECALFEFLLRHTNKYYTSKALRDSVWPADVDATDEAVRTCMKTLRQKLKSIGQSDLITTEAGAGYIITSNQN